MAASLGFRVGTLKAVRRFVCVCFLCLFLVVVPPYRLFCQLFLVLSLSLSLPLSRSLIFGVCLGVYDNSTMEYMIIVQFGPLATFCTSYFSKKHPASRMTHLGLWNKLAVVNGEYRQVRDLEPL